MIGWAIEALIASTLLMLAVLMLRGPVRRSFGAGIAYALWVLPVARLLLPPMPGQGWFSPILNPILDKLMLTQVIGGLLNPAGMTPIAAEQAVLVAELRSSAGRVDIAAIPPAIVDHGAPLAAVLVGVWLIGALLFMAWHVVRYWRFVGMMLSHARSISTGPVRVIKTDAASGPLAFGIWRKYIAFPSDFDTRYDADEQALAMAHELTHHARGDLIANWIALVVLAFHWFNPVAWRAFRAFRADQEMACDERVLAGRSAAVRHAYGRAIVKSAHGGAVAAACHLHTINDLKGRLRMLAKDRVSSARMATGMAAVAAIAAVTLGVTASGTEAAVPDAALDKDLAPLASVASAPAAPAAPEAKVERRTKIIIRNKDGKVETIDLKGDGADETGEDKIEAALSKALPGGKVMVFAPTIIETDCKDTDGKPLVAKDLKKGKRVLMVCRNVIAKLSKDAHRHADVHRYLEEARIRMLQSRGFEWNARRSALEGVRAAREGIIANRDLSDAARAAALKGIDQAIAELEADAAKAK
ncbi:MAG: peptidase M56 [Sphingomonas sp.]|uniref:M56 family metallopeptidase n=1 Tax=Sphingomonas sp. TaxID=28214 RepID=UPI0017A54F9D|nr:peptidase M56 [Sphingomonas sp.]